MFLLVDSPKRILLLGLGAGSTFQQLRYFFPNVWIDGVDIDPKMIEIGKRFFGLKRDKRSQFIIQDARRFLHKTPHTYDVVAVNLTAGSIFIPFYMATQEAFQQMKRRMQAKGWMLMNIVDVSKTKELAGCILHTAASVWRHVYSIRVGGNFVMLASNEPFSSLKVRKHLTASRSKLKVMVSRSLKAIKAWNNKPPHGCQVWTDDHSQLEATTFRTLKTLYP